MGHPAANMSAVLLTAICWLLGPGCVQADGGVKKKIIAKGEGWRRPEAGDTVSGELKEQQTT